MGDGNKIVVWRSTYREVNLAAFGHLFREYSEEVEDGCVALHVTSEGRDNGGQNILPGPHLYCQNGQTDTELYPNWPWSRGILLEEQQ